MFHDKKDEDKQTNTDIDQVAQDISGNDSQTPGIGQNPTTFNPVMPQQATTAPEPPATDDVSLGDDTQSDDQVVTPEPEVLDHHESHENLVTPTSHPVSSDLDEIKNQALQQLSPLVSKIDQAPEERFKTLMMLIQASDNHELIKDAYQAAQGIEDETRKAEALLAVVNEINYFSQKHA